MATTVTKTETFELQDGTEVTIRPLNIKNLRKLMKIVDEMSGIEKESDAVDMLVDACALAISRDNEELASDRDRLEEILDVPTMWGILGVAGGIEQDPNLVGGLVGKN